MSEMKMTDMKLTDQMTGHEIIAGHTSAEYETISEAANV